MKPRAELLSNISLDGNCDHYSLCKKEKSLHCVKSKDIVMINLQNYQKLNIAKLTSSSAFLKFSVIQVGSKCFLISSTDKYVMFQHGGDCIYQIYDGGRFCFSLDGFLMLNIKVDGTARVYRTDQIWIRLSQRDKHDEVLSVKKTELPVRSNAASKPPTEPLTTASGRGQYKQQQTRAERDYDQVLSQLTSGNLSPMLRHGTLTYPNMSRPTIWTQLLGLSRNKKQYLRWCRHHNTGTEQVLGNVIKWSPDLALVPHLSQLLQPFLQLFRGDIYYFL